MLYYDKKFTLKRLTQTVDSRWNQKDIETILYQEKKCSFWASSDRWQNNTNLSNRTDETTYNVNIQPIYSDVKKWDKIEIFDSINWNLETQGVYIITNVIFNKNFNGVLDNIELYVKNSTDGD